MVLKHARRCSNCGQSTTSLASFCSWLHTLCAVALKAFPRTSKQLLWTVPGRSFLPEPLGESSRSYSLWLVHLLAFNTRLPPLKPAKWWKGMGGRGVLTTTAAESLVLCVTPHCGTCVPAFGTMVATAGAILLHRAPSLAWPLACMRTKARVMPPSASMWAYTIWLSRWTQCRENCVLCSSSCACFIGSTAPNELEDFFTILLMALWWPRTTPLSWRSHNAL